MRLPGGRDVAAERGRRPEPGDDDLDRAHGRLQVAARPWVVTGSSRCSRRRPRRSSARPAASSGILTPNLSSACTAISTMDSESMSRSSTKDLSAVTSAVSMPATSSTISARPAEDLGRCRPRWFLLLVGVLVWHGRIVTGQDDDLARVGQARAEADEQHDVAGAHPARRPHVVQRHRDRRRRGVAGVDDVVGDDACPRGRPWLAQPLGDRLDDAQVGLVRHEHVDVGGRRARPARSARSATGAICVVAQRKTAWPSW